MDQNYFCRTTMSTKFTEISNYYFFIIYWRLYKKPKKIITNKQKVTYKVWIEGAKLVKDYTNQAC